MNYLYYFLKINIFKIVISMNIIILNTNEVKSRMFARLQEAFEADSQGVSHEDYVKNQNRYFNSVNHIIPSATSGLEINSALQSLDAMGQDYQNSVVPYPNDIFMKTTSPELSKLANKCASSSIDQLLAIKNPSAMDGTGCGWMYTPSATGSGTPALSKGFLGDVNGPTKITGMSRPAYQKWFFNLEHAKRQIMMDKCNAMRDCTEIQQPDFKTSCGWCGDRNQGVPVDVNGRLLYPNMTHGNCTSDNLYTDANKCPSSENSLEFNKDSTCIPVDGRLSVACLQQTLKSAGCGSNGALSIALSSATPSNYIENLPSSDAAKIYNRHVTPQFNFEMFAQGKTTVNAVIQEVRNLAGNALKPPTTAIGAAARDLCIKRGAVKQYDICSEYSDGSAPPFPLECLQNIFLKMGGHAKGTKFPTAENLTFYNAKGSLGAVKQYIQSIIEATNSTNYTTQRNAMIQLLGITSEELIRRAPYVQGVEVFWFVPRPGVVLKTGQHNPITGFLQRTIETNIVQLQSGPSRVSQLNGGAYGCMVQLFDVRTPVDFKTTFSVTVDDGFFIAVSQPAEIDKTVFNSPRGDEPGLFKNIGLQGPTTYISKKDCTFRSTAPNITKMYFEDAGGGWNSHNITVIDPEARKLFKPVYLSLTCDARAPFATFEVGRKSSVFEELRNPGIFSQFCEFNQLTPHNNMEHRRQVPGGKGFVRMNSSNGIMNLHNIAFQGWSTLTFAFRLQSMPISETLFYMNSGIPEETGPYFAINMSQNGNAARVKIRSTISMAYLRGGAKTGVSEQEKDTPYQLYINTWYLATIFHTETDVRLHINAIPAIAEGQGIGARSDITVSNNGAFYGRNETLNPTPDQSLGAADIHIGCGGLIGRRGVVSTGGCNMDVAWVHLFDSVATDADIQRDAKADWIYTQFPKAPNSY